MDHRHRRRYRLHRGSGDDPDAGKPLYDAHRKYERADKDGSRDRTGGDRRGGKRPYGERRNGDRFQGAPAGKNKYQLPLSVRRGRVYQRAGKLCPRRAALQYHCGEFTLYYELLRVYDGRDRLCLPDVSDYLRHALEFYRLLAARRIRL